MMTGCKISAIAHELPERAMTNQEIIDAEKLRLRDDWVRDAIGIEERRWCGEDETAASLAAAVCRKLVGEDVSSIDRLIVSTVSPQVVTPSTACIVQSLFAPGETFPCVDLVAACSGFLYALDFGRRCVQTGDRRVLCVATETRSTFLNRRDRRTVMLFGDGAAGVLLEPCEESEVGIVSTAVQADGRYWDAISVPVGGTITMNDGAMIASRAVEEMSELAQSAARRAELTLDDIDVFIFHQASGAIIARVCEQLGIGLDRTHLNFSRLGNTTSASVPLALAEAVRDGKIRRGARVLLVATGGGFTAGSALLRWELDS
jgi:3-oxoacyl-[acyl-carrier-protein] synthase III